MKRRFDFKELSTKEIQQIIQDTVAPRPIAFASTIDAAGNPNLSPFSFFNAFSANPPILIFSPARKGRDGAHKHSYLNIKEVPEVVINMVSFDMVEQMSLASTEYEKGVNEFLKSGFTPIPSETIRPFRVKESPVQFECDVIDIIELGQEAGSGNLIICKVKIAHIDSAVFDINENIDSDYLDLVGRMGGSDYIRASGEAIFKIAKPLAKIGIGIDSLPEAIRSSEYLTGNELARLGGLVKLPEFDPNYQPSIQDFFDAKELINNNLIQEALEKLLNNK